MTSARDMITAAAQTLKSAGIDSPRLDARLLLAHVLGIQPDVMLSTLNFPLPQGEGEDALKRFNSFIALRAAREPLAYIIGRKEFWSLSFAVGPGVLVPRPETETLIEEALRRFPDRGTPLRILDLGTGSGCLLLTLLHEFPNASGVGVDVSGEALQWAGLNAKAIGVASRCRLVNGDWNDIDEAGFDLVLSNPPYIARDEIPDLSADIVLHEPHTALDGGPDGLGAYRSLAACIGRFVAPKGVVLMEIGLGQASDVSLLLQEAGFAVNRPVDDLLGIARCIVASPNSSVIHQGHLRKRLEITC